MLFVLAPKAAWALDLEDELLLGLPEPEVEEPEPAPPRVLAVEGPGVGRGALALGMGLLDGLPALEARYLRGLGEQVDLELTLTSLGIVQRAQGAVRYRVLRSEEHALALRASLSQGHSVNEPFLFVGAGPGVLYSFGAEPVRFTASMDVAFPILSSSFDNRLGGAVFVHPAFGVELSIDGETELFLEGGVHAAVQSEFVRTFPVVSAGFAW